nr:hypothetical protein CFP56_10110 [Quercus suber]
MRGWLGCGYSNRLQHSSLGSPCAGLTRAYSDLSFISVSNVSPRTFRRRLNRFVDFFDKRFGLVRGRRCQILRLQCVVSRAVQILSPRITFFRWTALTAVALVSQAGRWYIYHFAPWKMKTSGKQNDPRPSDRFVSCLWPLSHRRLPLASAVALTGPLKRPA